MITTADYQLAADRAAHAHLLRLRDDLRIQTIQAWLAENRGHHKGAAVDELFFTFRISGNRAHLEDAEILMDRYTWSQP